MSRSFFLRFLPVRAAGVEPALDDGQPLRDGLEIDPARATAPVECRDRPLRPGDLRVDDVDEGPHDGGEVRDPPPVVEEVGQLVAPVGEEAVRGDRPVVPTERVRNGLVGSGKTSALTSVAFTCPETFSCMWRVVESRNRPHRWTPSVAEEMQTIRPGKGPSAASARGTTARRGSRPGSSPALADVAAGHLAVVVEDVVVDHLARVERQPEVAVEVGAVIDRASSGYRGRGPPVSRRLTWGQPPA